MDMRFVSLRVACVCVLDVDVDVAVVDVLAWEVVVRAGDLPAATFKAENKGLPMTCSDNLSRGGNVMTIARPQN